MNPASLPRTINPARLAKSNAQLEGTLLIKNLPRIKELVEEASGEVKLMLEFGIDKKGCVTIRGNIKTTLKLICQRCLESMDYPMDLYLMLSPLVADQTVEFMPEGYEPILLDEEGNIVLIELVEEEILLALPLVAKHDEC